MKTCLEARPVYVSDPETIFGHFLIVYYALTIMRLIEFKVFEDGVPVEQLFDFIRDYRVTENVDGCFVNNATDTPTYRAIKEKLGLSKLATRTSAGRTWTICLRSSFNTTIRGRIPNSGSICCKIE